MKKEILRLLVLSMAIITLSIISPFETYAQCGADGTKPCPKTTIKSKPKIVINKKSTTTNIKTTVTTNKSALFYKMLGKWKSEKEEAFLTFSANGTGLISNQKTVCATFSFVLKKDIAELNSKITQKCAEMDTGGIKTVKLLLKIQFDENNRLGTTVVKKDGSEDGSTTWATKVK